MVVQHDFRTSPSTHGLEEEVFLRRRGEASCLREEKASARSVTPRLALSQQQRALIEVDEDNDGVYSSTRLPLCCIIHPHPLPPHLIQTARLSLSDDPDCFLYRQATSGPAQPEHVWSVSVSVSMCVISSGLAALTWLGECVSILLVRGVVEALLTLSPLITP